MHAPSTPASSCYPLDLPFLFFSITWISDHCQALLFLNKMLHPWVSMAPPRPSFCIPLYLLVWHCLDLPLHSYWYLAKMDESSENRKTTHYCLVTSVTRSWHNVLCIFWYSSFILPNTAVCCCSLKTGKQPEPESKAPGKKVDQLA